MESIGESLREARESRGFTLEDVEKAIHIRVKHLAALESGELDLLPSPVQARGFLRNYAEHLGLDGDEIVTQYDELSRQGLVPRTGSAPAAPPRSAVSPNGRTQRALAGVTPLNVNRRARWFSVDLLVAGLITVGLIAVFVWGGAWLASRVFDNSGATPTLPAFLFPTASPASTLLLLGGLTETPSPPPPESFTNVQIKITVAQRAWVRIVTDGQAAFAGMLTPGQTLEYTGEKMVEIRTGNGAGLHVTFNGQDQGPLGQFGEVVDRIWTLDGVIIPTPSATSTPGPTDEPFPTPTP